MVWPTRRSRTAKSTEHDNRLLDMMKTLRTHGTLGVARHSRDVRRVEGVGASGRTLYVVVLVLDGLDQSARVAHRSVIDIVIDTVRLALTSTPHTHTTSRCLTASREFRISFISRQHAAAVHVCL